MIIINISIENEHHSGDKIYFDLVFIFNEARIKINNCFAESGKFGDWMLRLPTKKGKNGVLQINWLDDETFKRACIKVRKHFKEE
jgi:hypothetical protein